MSRGLHATVLPLGASETAEALPATPHKPRAKRQESRQSVYRTSQPRGPVLTREETPDPPKKDPGSLSLSPGLPLSSQMTLNKSHSAILSLSPLLCKMGIIMSGSFSHWAVVRTKGGGDAKPALSKCPFGVSTHKGHHLTRPSWVGEAGCSNRMLPVGSVNRTLLGRSSL